MGKRQSYLVTYAHEAPILLSEATDKIVNIEAPVLKHIVIIYNCTV